MNISERGVWEVINQTIRTGGSYEEVVEAGLEAGKLLGVPHGRVRELVDDAWSNYGS